MSRFPLLVLSSPGPTPFPNSEKIKFLSSSPSIFALVLVVCLFSVPHRPHRARLWT